MPRAGYRSITIRQDLYDLLNNLAEKEQTTIPKIIEQAVNTYIKREG